MKYNSWNLTKLNKLKKQLQDEFFRTNNDFLLDELYLIEQIINDNISLFSLPMTFQEKIQNDIIVMERYNYFLDSINNLINSKTYIPALEDYNLEIYKKLNWYYVLGFNNDFYN